MKIALYVVVALAGLLITAAGVLLAIGSRDGAGRYATSIEIQQPPARIWPWLREPEKLKAWVSWMVETRNETPGVTGVGSRQTWVMEDRNNNNARMEIAVLVREYEEARMLGVDTQVPGAFTGKVKYQLTELPNGNTRVELEHRYDFDSGFAKIMEPLITPQAEKKSKEDMARLKSVVESSR